MADPGQTPGVGELLAGYAAGTLRPEAVLRDAYAAIHRRGADSVWIHLLLLDDALGQLEAADRHRLEGGVLPLLGVPFAIKDNIDVAGRPTTAGCPAFAYKPETTATVVRRLQAAGAKTNLDQFATGLTGTRSPYGALSSVFDPDYIAGGSSSGSAVAVAARLVAFALGTDTAGSGRVPAGFNGIVGVKPTRGLISTAGVIPACRSLDCVSILAHTMEDAARVFDVARGPDPGTRIRARRRGRHPRWAPRSASGSPRRLSASSSATRRRRSSTRGRSTGSRAWAGDAWRSIWPRSGPPPICSTRSTTCGFRPGRRQRARTGTNSAFIEKFARGG
jgi:Asp-tRNA(Asn)/Glu-tRNA(Gln) amidotransferase A subunit family amidase